MVTDDKIDWNRAVLSAWNKRRGAGQDGTISSAEFDLILKWRDRSLPLSAIIRGIEETGGMPKTLHACVQAVERAAQYHADAMASSQALTELPKPFPAGELWDPEYAKAEKARLFTKYKRTR